MRKRPGKMMKEVLGAFFKKASTTSYPYVKDGESEGFRGKIEFVPEKCIGCKMCMRDCPSNAIIITPVGAPAEKRFDCTFDLGKCVYCGQCVDSCLKKALYVSKEFELAQLKSESLIVTTHAPEKPAVSPPQEA